MRKKVEFGSNRNLPTQLNIFQKVNITRNLLTRISFRNYDVYNDFYGYISLNGLSIDLFLHCAELFLRQSQYWIILEATSKF